MMGFVALAADLVGFWAFLAAMIVILSTPTSPDGVFNNSTRAFAACAAAIYVYTTGADLAEEFFLFSRADFLEGYLEMLFPVLALMTVYAAFAAQQYSDISRSQHALASSHDLMMGIVDSAPAGIMFLDDAGHTTFANNTAKEVLDLEEDPDTGQIAYPAWVIRDDRGEPIDGFRPLVREGKQDRVPLEICWPSGWRVDLLVSTEPLSNAEGRIGGVVATFERPARAAVEDETGAA